MPTKGGSVFFVNTDARHAPDRLALHPGTPVIKGVNKWLREGYC
jgi:hypothetical protein